MSRPCASLPSPSTAWDATSLAGALKAAAVRRSAPHVGPLHAVLFKLGLSASAILATSLAHLALRCGLPRYARDLFDEMPHPDVVSWTSLLTGHAHQGLHRESLTLLRRMVGFGVEPNGYTLSGGLLACAGVGQDALALGKEIHARVLKMSLHGPVDPVVDNGVLDMYSRCGSIKYASGVFSVMQVRNIVAWNSMMAALLWSGQAEEALRLFVSMVFCGVGVDGFSFSIVVDACGELALLKQGMQVHARIIGGGFEADAVVRNSLLDMYAKSGCVDSAELVFKVAYSQDAVLWTTMISAYGKFGRVQDAVDMFDRMAQLGITQDGIAYLAVLSACSHGGLVKEGWHYFNLMSDSRSSVRMHPEHYGCMADLLCRRGYLEEALEFIENMPFDTSIAAWSALLNSSRIHGNARLSQLAASHLLKLDPENHSNWVALSSVHASENDWHVTWTIRESMSRECVKKEPGCSWVELYDGVHIFLMADQSHPELFEILQTLDSLEDISVMPFQGT
ncbi:pentatricopeptide repeat-containing protein At3g24000, mitochondrial-like [Panicum virgatum]|uniref:Pentatricopeptide repeat-containing protein n=1 Tax=Panicum virgatum TaxID=38727 RepID=A0A8T0VA32_PANVG|nr:pentatricopeptide repeat-containing protein At3g24000, mitochondrial-like [Panicum virgatum]XP_039839131.1 pentatricopeptide repeat-containing protein At3g24000, mitochondrial-like [Panicum virgatum]XP_039839132.1 pentatricopeptide repeat-containing protein At3g24000, mitochondrial-like [Panicum virgatum]XP_039839133.1 pentatricopeptide repeat-containing protein At3g24000, mitochondrial-like [Panicum virgatum]XP_039839134.1 pentatricopeptide repeat-containing protein At3g24000, mitochondrial